MRKVNNSNVKDVSVINFKSKMNKRGQQMTLATLIAIVLGITVLVLLIFGFTTGWNNMWDRVTAGTSSSNIELKITDCEADCSAGESNAFCKERKDLRFFDEAGKIVKIKDTCNAFATQTLSVDNNAYQEKFTGAELLFKGCSTITCPTGTQAS